jgi:hypothetical protein
VIEDLWQNKSVTPESTFWRTALRGEMIEQLPLLRSHMAMTPQQLDARTQTFERMVTKHFGWLEREQGFRRGEHRVRYADEPRDAGVSVRFKRADLAIDVGMALYHDQAGLVLRDPNWHLKPEPKVKWLYLEELSDEAKKPWVPTTTLEVEFENLECRFRAVQSVALAPGGAVFSREMKRAK